MSGFTLVTLDRLPKMRGLFSALLVLSLSACSTVGYYAHLVHGEYSLLAARKPISGVLADPSADAQLKARLQLAERARAFASDHLGLPRNASYTKYADLKRTYATWNVFAAPEFSVDAVTHCFIIVGCLDYRGYYDRERADAEAAKLQIQGYETWVGGSAAYSTLGWFSDPILNTMLRWDDDELVGTIFHELAHQKLYVRSDTEFNESFASFVQREGVRQWRALQGLPPADDNEQAHDDQFTHLVLDTRERLRVLYALGLPTDVVRTRKRSEFDRLRQEYVHLRDSEWNGDTDYDGWINAAINNAKLLPFGVYNRWIPAFAALYAKNKRDWPAFYRAVAELARKKPDARKLALVELDAAAH